MQLMPENITTAAMSSRSTIRRLQFSNSQLHQLV